MGKEDEKDLKPKPTGDGAGSGPDEGASEKKEPPEKKDKKVEEAEREQVLELQGRWQREIKKVIEIVKTIATSAGEDYSKLVDYWQNKFNNLNGFVDYYLAKPPGKRKENLAIAEANILATTEMHDAMVEFIAATEEHMAVCKEAMDEIDGLMAKGDPKGTLAATRVTWQEAFNNMQETAKNSLVKYGVDETNGASNLKTSARDIKRKAEDNRNNLEEARRGADGGPEKPEEKVERLEGEAQVLKDELIKAFYNELSVLEFIQATGEDKYDDVIVEKKKRIEPWRIKMDDLISSSWEEKDTAKAISQLEGMIKSYTPIKEQVEESKRKYQEELDEINAVGGLEGLNERIKSMEGAVASMIEDIKEHASDREEDIRDLIIEFDERVRVYKDLAIDPEVRKKMAEVDMLFAAAEQAVTDLYRRLDQILLDKKGAAFMAERSMDKLGRIDISPEQVLEAAEGNLGELKDALIKELVEGKKDFANGKFREILIPLLEGLVPERDEAFYNRIADQACNVMRTTVQTEAQRKISKFGKGKFAKDLGKSFAKVGAIVYGSAKVVVGGVALFGLSVGPQGIFIAGGLLTTSILSIMTIKSRRSQAARAEREKTGQQTEKELAKAQKEFNKYTKAVAAEIENLFDDPKTLGLAVSNDIRIQSNEESREKVEKYQTATNQALEAGDIPSESQWEAEFQKALEGVTKEIFLDSLNHIKSEYPDATPDEQRQMAVMMSAQLWQEQRNLPGSNDVIKDISQKRSKLFNFIKKYAGARAAEGVDQKGLRAWGAGGLTVLSGAVTTLGMRSTNPVLRAIAGFAGGASIGLNMAEREGWAEDAQFKHIEEIIGLGKKILGQELDEITPAVVGELREQASFLRAQVELGMLKKYPAVAEEVKQFIDDVEQLAFQEIKSLNDLLERMSQDTDNKCEAMETIKEEVEKKGKSRRRWLTYGIGALGSVMSLGFMQWQKINESGAFAKAPEPPSFPTSDQAPNFSGDRVLQEPEEALRPDEQTGGGVVAPKGDVIEKADKGFVAPEGEDNENLDQAADGADQKDDVVAPADVEKTIEASSEFSEPITEDSLDFNEKYTDVERSHIAGLVEDYREHLNDWTRALAEYKDRFGEHANFARFASMPEGHINDLRGDLQAFHEKLSDPSYDFYAATGLEPDGAFIGAPNMPQMLEDEALRQGLTEVDPSAGLEADQSLEAGAAEPEPVPVAEPTAAEIAAQQKAAFEEKHSFLTGDEGKGFEVGQSVEGNISVEVGGIGEDKYLEQVCRWISAEIIKGEIGETLSDFEKTRILVMAANMVEKINDDGVPGLSFDESAGKVVIEDFDQFANSDYFKELQEHAEKIITEENYKDSGAFAYVPNIDEHDYDGLGENITVEETDMDAANEARTSLVEDNMEQKLGFNENMVDDGSLAHNMKQAFHEHNFNFTSDGVQVAFENHGNDMLLTQLGSEPLPTPVEISLGDLENNNVVNQVINHQCVEHASSLDGVDASAWRKIATLAGVISDNDFIITEADGKKIDIMMQALAGHDNITIADIQRIANMLTGVSNERLGQVFDNLDGLKAVSRLGQVTEGLIGLAKDFDLKSTGSAGSFEIKDAAGRAVVAAQANENHVGTLYLPGSEGAGMSVDSPLYAPIDYEADGNTLRKAINSIHELPRTIATAWEESGAEGIKEKVQEINLKEFMKGSGKFALSESKIQKVLEGMGVEDADKMADRIMDELKDNLGGKRALNKLFNQYCQAQGIAEMDPASADQETLADFMDFATAGERQLSLAEQYAEGWFKGAAREGAENLSRAQREALANATIGQLTEAGKDAKEISEALFGEKRGVADSIEAAQKTINEYAQMIMAEQGITEEEALAQIKDTPFREALYDRAGGSQVLAPEQVDPSVDSGSVEPVPPVDAGDAAKVGAATAVAGKVVEGGPEGAVNADDAAANVEDGSEEMDDEGTAEEQQPAPKKKEGFTWGRGEQDLRGGAGAVEGAQQSAELPTSEIAVVPEEIEKLFLQEGWQGKIMRMAEEQVEKKYGDLVGHGSQVGGINRSLRESIANVTKGLNDLHAEYLSAPEAEKEAIKAKILDVVKDSKEIYGEGLFKDIEFDEPADVTPEAPVDNASVEDSAYVGEMKDGVRTGQGTYTWPDGEVYDGDFKDGIKNGQGTYTWPDGSKYVGEWKDDMRHGQGIHTLADGSQKAGQWVEGKFAEDEIGQAAEPVIEKMVEPDLSYVDGVLDEIKELVDEKGQKIFNETHAIGQLVFNGDFNNMSLEKLREAANLLDKTWSRIIREQVEDPALADRLKQAAGELFKLHDQKKGV